ncbi:transcriptional sir2 family protein [Stylonychia lemnae]|uniref:Regulatory protein SIR2 homolog 7 n=1 Tax=Stylonychia lemnae TaxID=5949 RepID=A0A077ZUH2_STYLE|nr:transcriptional sir2 family protein [Stylonychia lemnae]|eukprot:CDW73522.1 transcriptional sir2 family protein [Stylonychia lemnae]
MADTAIKSEEEKKEYFDTPEVLDQKVEMLALWIKSSEHFVAFTGAGISTSAGIPDFRSGANTVLQTGPGVWEKAAFKEAASKKGVVRTNIQKAYPTSTHMAFVELQNRGHLKFLISQNVDGLHRKSGIPPESISELHGNTNVEICTKCEREFLRDYRVRNAQQVHDHKTGRKCDDPTCRGDLIDTIINFKEVNFTHVLNHTQNLREKDLDLGFGHSAEADLHLVMGSSLRVTPAADMPMTTVSKGGKLVIVNLQKTPADYAAALIINGRCDDVMRLLMKKLGYDIPEWRLQRRFQVSLEQRKSGDLIQVRGVDVNLSPYSLFTKVEAKDAQDKGLYTAAKKEPFEVRLPDNCEDLKIKLHFQGHYEEPTYLLNLDMKEFRDNNYLMTYLMVFNPAEKVWEFCVPI